MTILLWAVFGVSVFVLVVFFGKELLRNGRVFLTEILNTNNKKNINDLFGISKTTFLSVVISTMILCVALLSLLETAKVNFESNQVLEKMLDRLKE